MSAFRLPHFLLCVVAATACGSSAGSFVSNIHRQGDGLIVERCEILQSGETISRGACSSKTLSVPEARANRAPRYMYLPNAEVGVVRSTKRDAKKGEAQFSTFSYTAAPGLVFTLDVRIEDDRVVKDAMRVGITFDSWGESQLTGATAVTLLIDGKPTKPVYFDWSGRKRKELTHETMRKLLSARWMSARLRGVRNLEIQFGDHAYALPRHATDKLSDFAAYVEARLPPTRPTATAAPST